MLPGGRVGNLLLLGLVEDALKDGLGVSPVGGDSEAEVVVHTGHDEGNLERTMEYEGMLLIWRSKLSS